MLEIISKEGYPKDNQIMARLDYFIGSNIEGGILIVGKDSQGREYRPRNKPPIIGSYTLPSGSNYSVPVGKTPAIFYPFELNAKLRYPEILETEQFDDEFFSKFDLQLMGESRERIKLEGDVERLFKEIACWGAWELACATEAGAVRNHFWGEMYRERTGSLEKFLEQYRDKNEK